MKDYLEKNRYAIVIVVLIILAPLALNIFFLFGDMRTGSELSNADWLLFWGSFLGGIATLAAVFLTLNQNAKLIEQNQERERLNLMPYLDYLPDEKESIHLESLIPPNVFLILESNDKIDVTTSMPKRYQTLIDRNFMLVESNGEVDITRVTGDYYRQFKLVQKSNNLAKDVKVSISTNLKSEPLKTATLFTLSSKESLKMPILISNTFPRGSVWLVFDFEDIEERNYRQVFRFDLTNENMSFKGISSPKLIK